jgi:hypothetical protein
MNITISPNKSQVIINLFNFFVSHILNQNTKNVNFKSKVKDFFNTKNQQEKDKLKIELQSLSFYDINNYTLKSDLSEQEI